MSKRSLASAALICCSRPLRPLANSQSLGAARVASDTRPLDVVTKMCPPARKQMSIPTLAGRAVEEPKQTLMNVRTCTRIHSLTFLHPRNHPTQPPPHVATGDAPAHFASLSHSTTTSLCFHQSVPLLAPLINSIICIASTNQTNQ